MPAPHKYTPAEAAELIADKQRYPTLMTVAEVAAFCRVSTHTVYGWSSQGKLDKCKCKSGRRALFSRDALCALLLNGGLK